MIGIKLSTKTRYGLRVMFDLAQYSNGKPISLSVIAERQKLPLNYLEQIMLLLKNAELVVSVRGAYGGYKINGELSEITVKDIFDVLEGPVMLSDCIKTDGCGKSNYCITRLIYKELSDTVNDVIVRISLQDMVNDKKEMKNNGILIDI